jgi:hypothetical protein
MADPEKTCIARPRLGEQVPAEMNKQATVAVLLSYNDGNGVSCRVRPKVI